jgi:hypothetical protein
MKPPMYHKVKRPFRYTPANSTDISRRFEGIRRLERMKSRKSTVTKFRKVSHG